MTAVASYYVVAAEFLFWEKCNIFDQNYPDIRTPEISPKYPEVGANGTRTHSMLADEAFLLYSATATNRQVYVRTYDILYISYLRTNQ